MKRIVQICLIMTGIFLGVFNVYGSSTYQILKDQQIEFTDILVEGDSLVLVRNEKNGFSSEGIYLGVYNCVERMWTVEYQAYDEYLKSSWQMIHEKQETDYLRWYWNVWKDGRKNMNKYDSMIACNKKASEEKVNRAVTEIRQMLTEREKVTVPKLTKRTGLSRGFFYKNETVRKEMDRALEQQAGMIDPKRYIGDIVLKNRINVLEEQIRELKREKEQMEKENVRLRKALNKKDLNVLKTL